MHTHTRTHAYTHMFLHTHKHIILHLSNINIYKHTRAFICTNLYAYKRPVHSYKHLYTHSHINTLALNSIHKYMRQHAHLHT